MTFEIHKNGNHTLVKVNSERLDTNNAPDLKQYNSNYLTVNYLFSGSEEIAVNFFQGSFYKIEQLKNLEKIKEKLMFNRPDLFICGHSHILKVMPDRKLGLLHINPGAAGNHGMHHVRTAVRFIIDGSRIKDLEVWEVGR